MDLVIDALSYLLVAIMLGICGAWVFLIKSMSDSFRLTPFLDRFDEKPGKSPKVSVILPARNEEKFIGRCLESLIHQNYQNYEIVVIDDSSDDSTGKIIEGFAKKSSKVVPVSAMPKPEGWMGKNWACMEGFRKAEGELLLFTDADTYHSENVISLSVKHMLSENLDALSAIPRMLTFDFWTRITLPMISTFLHTRFSALNVNNPKKKTGYFFGSFFIIKKEAYKEVGMHEGVKHEIVEDGALGKIVKEAGYKMKMVRAEHLIDAVWARDKSTLWNALKRLMVPLYLQNGNIAIGIFFAVLFLLFVPFPVLAASAIFPAKTMSSQTLLATSAIASVLIYIGASIETKIGLEIKPIYAFFAPAGGLVVILGFFTGLVHARSSSSVTWRGRSYSMKDHNQSSISI